MLVTGTFSLASTVSAAPVVGATVVVLSRPSPNLAVFHLHTHYPPFLVESGFSRVDAPLVSLRSSKSPPRPFPLFWARFSKTFQCTPFWGHSGILEGQTLFTVRPFLPSHSLYTPHYSSLGLLPYASLVFDLLWSLLIQSVGRSPLRLSPFFLALYVLHDFLSYPSLHLSTLFVFLLFPLSFINISLVLDSHAVPAHLFTTRLVIFHCPFRHY